MPAGETSITIDVVRALLQEQHADWADLPLVEAGEGWDNKQFRLGRDLVVRLPRRQIAAALIEHEQRWLPLLAARLPLPVPAPIRVGRAGCGYPWAWSITPWFEGTVAVTAMPDGMPRQLAQFLLALHRPAPLDAPVNPFRTSLASRSAVFADNVLRLRRDLDRSAAEKVWNAGLRAPAWAGPPVWIHGDLHPANLIVHEEQLRAVIDFGDLTAGDPAVDLAVAWMLWTMPARHRFRDLVDRGSKWMDEATWRRARAWALGLGVTYLTNSEDNPTMATIGRRTVGAALSDPI